MTQNQIRNREAIETARKNASEIEEKRRSREETQRANRENESNTRRGQNLKLTGDVIGAITGLAGTAAKAFANSPEWYNLDKQLVADVANIPYGTPLGIDVEIGEGTKPLPGVCMLDWTPCIGTNYGESASVNVAAKNIYTFVRHANSGHANYDAPDLMMYLLAVDEVYSQISELVKVYKIMLTYPIRNRYWAKTIVSALGYDYDDLAANLANFRTLINMSIARINAFCVPKEMSLIIRHAWIASNMFYDSDIKKAGLYVFSCKTYGIYDDAKGCIIRDRKAPNLKVGGISVMLETMIGSLVSSEDIGIMNGDILKAYGQENVFQFPSVPEEVTITPLYSEEVLSQINNATICGDITIYNQDINQYNGIFQLSDGTIHEGSFYVDENLVSNSDRVGYCCNCFANLNPALSTAVNANINAPNLQKLNFARTNDMVNMYKDDVSTDDTMVATRLKTLGYLFVRGNNPYLTMDVVRYVTNYGTELINKMTLITLDNANGTYKSREINSREWLMDGLSYDVVHETITDLAKFDWAPAVLLFEFGSPDGFVTWTVKNYGYLTDICNYAILSEQTLRNMHQVAVLSEFGIPYIGDKIRGNTKKGF